MDKFRKKSSGVEATYERAGVPDKEQFALAKLKTLLGRVRSLHIGYLQPDTPPQSARDFISEEIALFDNPEFIATERALDAALEKDNE